MRRSWPMPEPSARSPRFLTLTDVAEVLNTSVAQVYALVRRGELPAIKLGGRGQWRVEASRLEDYIAQLYRETDDLRHGAPVRGRGRRVADVEEPAD